MTAKTESNISSYLIIYGSLLSKFSTQEDLGLHNKMTLVGQCKLPGCIYDLGTYPGLILNDKQGEFVEAELYRFSDQNLLAIMDDYEGFKAGNEQGSLYKRMLITLLEPPIKAWVYLYNQAILESNLIKSGSWEQHLLLKNALNVAGENNG